MNPGLKQGFVRFGTAAHTILITMHELGGKAYHHQIVTESELDPNHVGMNLTRLRKGGFIFEIGRVDGYVELCRTQKMFALIGSKHRKIQPFANKTGTERCRAMRARKRLRVPSIFQFRGTIQIEKRKS